MTEPRAENTLATLPPVDQLLADMARELKAILANKGPEPLFIGIHTGGVWIARHLTQALNLDVEISSLDVSLYRDDYASKGIKADIRASQLPDSMADRHIVLVDDVIMTGRTIRGALNLIFDYGRPASVTLVEMIDLPARELPLQADVVGHRLKEMPAGRIRLAGPDPLRFTMENWDGDA